MMMAANKGPRTPLAFLLKRELACEKIGNPDIVHGQANKSRKGEDFTYVKSDCKRCTGDGDSSYSVFGVFDGHNGPGAAIYTKENLLNNVLSAVPSNLNGDEWAAALPRALVSGFVKTDKDFEQEAQTSGSTVTFMIIEGWVLTVASVGDSRCVLEAADGSLIYLSADHRLDCNEEEQERITSSGGVLRRVYTGRDAEMGPLRCWPGGLCLSRSIGDLDVGEFIVPVPYVKQVKLSTGGGRVIMASDGVWDALSAEAAFDCCRGLAPDAAAAQIVNEAVQGKGLRDDTTCIVVDILPQEKPILTHTKTKCKGVCQSVFGKKSCDSTIHADVEYIEPYEVEQMFEAGSAMLSERLHTRYPLSNMFKLFTCAVCQVNMKPKEGVSIHAGSIDSRNLHPFDGPFLCLSCQEKKEAMEGKRSSRGANAVH